MAGSQSSANLINEGILAGQKIAKASIVTLISIGIVELVIGHISGSVVATADGLDSLSDAMISFIVLLGLRIAHKPADKTFHFGYHKVESFAALMARYRNGSDRISYPLSFLRCINTPTRNQAADFDHGSIGRLAQCHYIGHFK